MAVALFVESVSATLCDDGSHGKDQTLIVPVGTSIHIYHRISTGKRGRGEAWQITPITDLPATQVITKPVAIRLTTADIEALGFNRVTGISVKAITASENAERIEMGTHQEVVVSLVARIEAQDDTLSEFITDSRFSDPASVFKSPTPATATINIPVRVPVGASPVVELATIPDRKWAKEYIQRNLVGNLTEFDVYDEAMRTNTNVLIKGHAGSGKTMSVLAYASQRGLRYYNVSASAGTSVDQLLGKYVPDPLTQHFHWIDGAVTYLFRHGGVLLLNEINFLPERITTVLFSALDDRREIQLMDKDGEVIKAHPDLLIVGDMNPGYKGTRPMNQAWADRFRHVLDFPYDNAIEKRLIPNKAILDMASQLRDRFDKEELSTPISTRALVGFQDNLDSLGIDYAMYAYLNTFGHEKERASVKLVLETYRENILPTKLSAVHTDSEAI